MPRDESDGHVVAYPIGFLMPIYFSAFGGVDDVVYRRQWWDAFVYSSQVNVVHAEIELVGEEFIGMQTKYRRKCNVM